MFPRIASAGFGFLVGTVLVAAPPTSLPPPKTPPKVGLPVIPAPLANPIVGDYTIIAGEEHGKPIPGDRIRGSVVQITPERIVGTDKDRKEIFTSIYVIDFNVRPWTIQMKSDKPDADSKGLIKKEGDVVTIIYALPGGETPTEFKTKDKQHMFVLQAQKGTRPESGNVPEK